MDVPTTALADRLTRVTAGEPVLEASEAGVGGGGSSS